MAKTPERFTWATSVIDPKQYDNILEIGCGTGILLEQIAGVISKGLIVALDKSQSALQKASTRNKKFTDGKIVELISGEFSKLDFKAKRFNKIVAFNVNFFLKNSPEEFKLLQKILKPNGQLYVFYQMPYEIDSSAMKPLIKNLESFGFKIKESGIKKMKPTSSLFITAVAI